jgi:ABC-type branched-subunit amino acid transport system substrate-binding protein
MELKLNKSLCRLKAGLLAVSLALGAGCGSSDATDPDAVKVGLLLPFTGTESATAGNFERAVLLARDRINAGGGINGHRLVVISADTHSDHTRARESAEKLIAAGVRVIIGAESAEIAADIKPMLDAQQIVFLSPLVGAADDLAVDCTIPWFRLAPSSRALGESLAKQAFADGLLNVGLFHSDGAYDQALGSAFTKRFLALGGTVAFETVLARDAQSYSGIIPPEFAQVDAVMLAATPRSAALLVDEARFLDQGRARWYLSPLLKTELFLQNVAPGALDDSSGVTPRIFDTSQDFPSAFAARWLGDKPLDGAYFYYDAMALIGFALQKAATADPNFTADALRAAVLSSVGPNGEAAGWNTVTVSIPRLAAKDNLYYTGLTGPMLLLPCGDRRSGATSLWSIEGGQIKE